jgi:ABC-2 type transport system ATP-binding protein
MNLFYVILRTIIYTYLVFFVERGSRLKALEVIEVTTEIDQKKLIDHASFSLPQGTITALVGHNGAGKSTLLKTIMGMIKKAQGKIIINESFHQDDDFITFKLLLSYLPEEPMLLTELTVMQHFQLYGMSYEIAKNELNERIDRMVKGFELVDKLDEYPESLSKGMRQKVQTICALLPDTPLLLIDEPFMGLDIYAIDYFEQLMKEKIARGTTVLVTSHQLERMKGIADAFIMLKEGKIHSQGPINQFATIDRRTKK